MTRTEGTRAVGIGLVDGAVDSSHPDFAHASIRVLGPRTASSGFATVHATLLARLLVGREAAGARGICPECSLVARPIFAGGDHAAGAMPTCRAADAAPAIVELVDQRVRVINLSIGLTTDSLHGSRDLHDAIDYAMRRGVLVVVAAGNQARVGAPSLARHEWPIPAVAADASGRPIASSNLGPAIGRLGLLVTAPNAATLTIGVGPQIGGTSVAAAIVTGAVALLASLIPDADAPDIRLALGIGRPRVRSLVPPRLDAWGAYQRLRDRRIGKGSAA